MVALISHYKEINRHLSGHCHYSFPLLYAVLKTWNGLRNQLHYLFFFFLNNFIEECLKFFHGKFCGRFSFSCFTFKFQWTRFKEKRSRQQLVWWGVVSVFILWFRAHGASFTLDWELDNNADKFHPDMWKCNF